MITLLSLGIMFIGIIAVRARKISRSIGKIWIDLEIYVSIAYILIMWGLRIYDRYFGIRSEYLYVTKVTLFILALATYMLCAVKITIGLSRVREKVSSFIVFPFIVQAIFLLVINPINHVAYFDSVKGVVSIEKLIFISLSAIIHFTYYVMTVYLAVRHRRRIGTTAVGCIVLIVTLDFIFMICHHMVKDFDFMGAVFAACVTFNLIMLYLVDNPMDYKTGIYKKSAFFRAVEEELALNPNTSFKLCILDIRDFQDVNERFGFERGDDILMRVAQAMRKSFSWDVELGYMGEDNFVGLFPDGDYWMLQSSLSLDDMYPGENMDYTLSLYAGIYNVTDRKMNPILMCDRARFAMDSIRHDYDKHECIYDEEQDRKFEMQAYMLHNCDRAIHERDFVTYFQPIYDIKSRTICSAEALVRWKDKQYGLISPGDFVPLFENNGFINKLDIYVWESVCRQIHDWRNEGILVPPISVNISRKDLQMENLYEIILDLVKKYNLSPQDLKLEITESAFVSENSGYFETVNLLKEVGFRILMDDFGSGYSSLNTFKDAHVDILKADMGFMDGIESSEKGKIVIDSIVDMAKKLDIPIVVEGVETPGQLEFLKEKGCEMAQGYLLSRPVPSTEFKEMLKKRQ